MTYEIDALLIGEFGYFCVTYCEITPNQKKYQNSEISNGRENYHAACISWDGKNRWLFANPVSGITEELGRDVNGKFDK